MHSVGHFVRLRSSNAVSRTLASILFAHNVHVRRRVMMMLGEIPRTHEPQNKCISMIYARQCIQREPSPFVTGTAWSGLAVGRTDGRTNDSHLAANIVHPFRRPHINAISYTEPPRTDGSARCTPKPNWPNPIMHASVYAICALVRRADGPMVAVSMWLAQLTNAPTAVTGDQ